MGSCYQVASKEDDGGCLPGCGFREYPLFLLVIDCRRLAMTAIAQSISGVTPAAYMTVVLCEPSLIYRRFYFGRPYVNCGIMYRGKDCKDHSRCGFLECTPVIDSKINQRLERDAYNSIQGSAKKWAISCGNWQRGGIHATWANLLVDP